MLPTLPSRPHAASPSTRHHSHPLQDTHNRAYPAPRPSPQPATTHPLQDALARSLVRDHRRVTTPVVRHPRSATPGGAVPGTSRTINSRAISPALPSTLCRDARPPETARGARDRQRRSGSVRGRQEALSTGEGSSKTAGTAKYLLGPLDLGAVLVCLHRLDLLCGSKTEGCLGRRPGGGSWCPW
jgi:hypothetical protein